MRIKLLSPDGMSPDQKAIYDEAVAGKRGSAPAPMMAWLNSPDMARHATRLGEQLRFNTMFPPKLSEIAILVTARTRWMKDFAADRNTRSQKFYRLINEVPTLLMIGIVMHDRRIVC